MAKRRRNVDVPNKPADWPDWLLALRQRLHITQAEAAARIGIRQPQWSKWERGTQKPDRSHAILLWHLANGKLINLEDE